MKIKSIAAICKKSKGVVLFNQYSESGNLTQYIGDGAAAYPVGGLPELDGENVLTIFDVPEKDRDNYSVKTTGVPEGINLDDADENEKPVEREAISIVYSGKNLKPLRTSRGLVFIESRYLLPISDVMDILELYERFTPSGTTYIAAKAGFLLQAVIMPFDVINQQFVDQLQELTKQCALSLDLRKQEEARARAAEPEQISLNVDPETGEVIDDREKRGFTETETKCPFCEGENANARVFEDKTNKEYFVYCPICGIETKESFTSKAKALKAFSEGETKSTVESDGAGKWTN